MHVGLLQHDAERASVTGNSLGLAERHHVAVQKYWAIKKKKTSPPKKKNPRPTSNPSGMKYSQLLLWFLVNKPQICSGDLGLAVKLQSL